MDFLKKRTFYALSNAVLETFSDRSVRARDGGTRLRADVRVGTTDGGGSRRRNHDTTTSRTIRTCTLKGKTIINSVSDSCRAPKNLRNQHGKELFSCTILP